MSSFQVICLLFCRTSSRSIVIQNAGFEVDTMPNDDAIPECTYRYGDPIITDWSPYDPYNIIDQRNIGIENTIHCDSYSTNPPEGNQNAYLYKQGTITSQEFGIEQLLSDTLIINTVYTLTVYIGNPGPGTWSSSDLTHTIEANGVSFNGFPGYRIDLLAGNNVLISDSNTVSPSDTYWAETSATITITSDNPFIGETLSIRLINLNEAEGDEVGFDDVRLEATTVTPTLASDTVYSNKHHIELRLKLVIGFVACAIVCCLCCSVAFINILKRKKIRKYTATSVNISSVDTSEQITIKISSSQCTALSKWLYSIGFPEYYPLFIKQGFDSMHAIQCIEGQESLNKIGVKKVGHQMFIWTEIQKLKLLDTKSKSPSPAYGTVEPVLYKQHAQYMANNGLLKPNQEYDTLNTQAIITDGTLEVGCNDWGETPTLGADVLFSTLPRSEFNTAGFIG